MDITEKSDPYLLTFLAHKVAYDSFVGKSAPPVVSLRELRATPGQSLADIALAYETDPSELEKYNKWLLGGTIPSDKDYYVMLPVRHTTEPGIIASTEPVRTAPVRQTAATPAAGSIIKRNNLKAIVAGKGDTKDKLAIKAGITTRKLLRFNDMRDFDKFEEGEAYYIEAKRLNADTEYHVVQHGETMQEIAQLYGIRMDYLQFKNRMKRAEVPVPGRVLWLQKRRPAKVAVEVRELKPVPAAEKPVMAAQEKAPQTATTTASAKPSSTTTTATKEPAPQQEDFLTRFKRSWNKLKGQPTEPAAAEEQTTTATRETEQITKAEPVKASEQVIAPEEEVTIEEAVPTKNESVPAPVMRAPAQEKKAVEPKPAQKATEPASKQSNAGLYPSKKAQETEQKQVIEQKEQTEEVEEENAEWAAGLGEDVFVGFSGGEEEETELLVVEKSTETTAKTATTNTTAKAEPAAKPAAAGQTAETKPAPVAKPARHVVKQGETLYSISRLYAVTINDISTWNNLGDAPLKIGQELIIAEPLTIPADTKSEAKAETKAEAEPSNTIHTVVAGESLYVLSRKYNVTVNELKSWNNLNSNALSIGQQLRVTAPADQEVTNEDLEEEPAATFSGETTQHTVVSGESLYQISRKYGVTIKDIMEWNNKSDFNVKPGDKLTIRKK